MAIENYTAYLGKQVIFTVPFTRLGDFLSSEGICEKVSGTIDMVCVAMNHQDSTFFLNNDENYSFSEVTFIDELPNPTKTS